MTAAIIGNPTKQYDGTTAATLTPANFSLTGLVGSESLTVSQTAGTYNGKNAGSATTVTATLAPANFTAGPGVVPADYTLPTTASGTGSITAATLTAAIVGNPTKQYDGTTAVTLTPANFSIGGLAGSDRLHRDPRRSGHLQQQ